MTRAEIEREILELVEEDFYGLWEIAWRIHTVLGVDPAVHPKSAAEIIETLRRHRLVDIFVRDGLVGLPVSLGLSGLSLDLSEARAWQVPGQGEPQFLLGPPQGE